MQYGVQRLSLKVVVFILTVVYSRFGSLTSYNTIISQNYSAQLAIAILRAVFVCIVR